MNHIPRRDGVVALLLTESNPRRWVANQKATPRETRAHFPNDPISQHAIAAPPPAARAVRTRPNCSLALKKAFSLLVGEEYITCVRAID
jgi:hypothetical protein